MKKKGAWVGGWSERKNWVDAGQRATTRQHAQVEGQHTNTKSKQQRQQDMPWTKSRGMSGWEGVCVCAHVCCPFGCGCFHLLLLLMKVQLPLRVFARLCPASLLEPTRPPFGTSSRQVLLALVMTSVLCIACLVVLSEVRTVWQSVDPCVEPAVT